MISTTLKNRLKVLKPIEISIVTVKWFEMYKAFLLKRKTSWVKGSGDKWIENVNLYLPKAVCWIDLLIIFCKKIQTQFTQSTDELRMWLEMILNLIYQ